MNPDRVPGNFYFFRFWVELQANGKTYVGLPKQAIRQSKADGTTEVRWGSPVDLAWPNPNVAHAQWVGDPKTGVASLRLWKPEDLVGAEGNLGDRKFRFEAILDAGKNQIVYSLFCEQGQFRIAFGFPRDMFVNAANHPS